MLFFDPVYLMFMLPAFVLSMFAQMWVGSAYSRWSQTPNAARLAGPEVARLIMKHARLNVALEVTPQEMSDHYDPRTHTVRMSPKVARTDSVASMAIVAHELGHAQQHQQGSPLIVARNFLLPAVQVSPMLSYGLILAGLFFGLTGLAKIGLIFFGVTVVFMLLTLPVEIDASLRGLKLLDEIGLLSTRNDSGGARAMLTAAAFTYIAAAVTAVMQMLYFVSLINRRD